MLQANSEDVMSLREWFKGMLMLLEVIDALLELDQGTSLRKHKRVLKISEVRKCQNM